MYRTLYKMPANRNFPRFDLYMPQSMLDGLHALSRVTGTTMQQIGRDAIHAHLLSFTRQAPLPPTPVKKDKK